MRPLRMLICVAGLPLGCSQEPQTAPPPPPAVRATPAPPISDASPASAPLPITPTPAAVSPVPVAPRVVSAKPRPSRPDASLSNSAPRPVAIESATKVDKIPETARTPVRVRLDVPTGTRLPIEIQTTLSSATSKQGDPVLGVLTADVALKGFELDKGAEVRGVVTTVVSAKRVKGRAQLVMEFDAVMKDGEKLSITTDAFDTLAAPTAGKDKKIIAGSAAGGLVIGAITRGRKGAAVGTLIGAAAGAGAVMVMKGDEVEIPRGARLTVTVIK